jgi:hypothetical protein
MSEPTDRPEIEIIPPGQPDRRRAAPRWSRQGGRDDPRVFLWSSGPRGMNFRASRPSPLGLLAIFLGIAALSTLGFLVFLGLAAIALPLIGAVVLAGVVASILRRL